MINGCGKRAETVIGEDVANKCPTDAPRLHEESGEAAHVLRAGGALEGDLQVAPPAMVPEAVQRGPHPFVCTFALSGGAGTPSSLKAHRASLDAAARAARALGGTKAPSRCHARDGSGGHGGRCCEGGCDQLAMTFTGLLHGLVAPLATIKLCSLAS